MGKPEGVAASPTPPKRVVIASEPITNVDVTRADVVTELDQTLAARKIELCFA
jgi:hypothetical protein